MDLLNFKDFCHKIRSYFKNLNLKLVHLMKEEILSMNNIIIFCLI